ncbi:MAG: DUF3786 domain-containing protein [Thermodesulfobacteriota bacterium]
MSEPAAVFDQIYREYLDRVARIDWRPKAELLGIQVGEHGITIPFFGVPYRIDEAGISDLNGNRPIQSVSVSLCQYLLLSPDATPEGDDWVTYKDFKDAAPFAGAFTKNVENAIADRFSGRLPALKAAADRLESRPSNLDLSHDFHRVFIGLPRIPLLLAFNDEDEDFPAQATVLFERRAERYLDMECLAMVGWLLCDRLRHADGETEGTIT